MNARRVIVTGITALLLIGCSDNRQNLQAFVASVRSRPAPPIEDIPRIRSYTHDTYTAQTRHSPFTAAAESPPTAATAADGLQATGLDLDPDRPLAPLEHFPLSSLTMVGTITIGNVRYALIHAPDGIVYRARVGDYAGRDHGRITAISGDAVILTEIVPDGTGGYMKRPAMIPSSP